MSTEDKTTESTKEADTVETTETAEETVDETATAEETTEETKDSEHVETIDFDAELEKERKGKPDPKKAREAFKDREERRKDRQDDDQPLTRRDIEEVEARAEARAFARIQQDRAFELARQMAGSDKEAELIVEKWRNRTFPQALSLTEQIEESYAITHRKRIVSERNEALRSLKNKDMTNRTAAATHRESAGGPEPKLAPTDEQAIKAAGFSYNPTSRRFEKKLRDGSILARDPKTKATIRIPRPR